LATGDLEREEELFCELCIDGKVGMDLLLDLGGKAEEFPRRVGDRREEGIVCGPIESFS